MVNVGNQILVTDTNGKLFHTIRVTGGTWEGFGDVKSQAGDRGFFTDIADANVASELQTIGVTNDGKLWHTIRHANGTWDHFIDVKSQAGNPGAFTSVGITYGDELQVSGVTKNGGLWHTIRHLNGTWDHFIDVKSQAGNPGAFTSVASAYVLVTIPARVVILVQDVGPRFLDAHEIPQRDSMS